MDLRYRYRRGLYPHGEGRRFPQRIRALLTLLLIAAVVYGAGGWVLRMFGVGNPLLRASATLVREERGIVSVSLHGEQEQNAENGMSLFDGDKLSTGPNAHASLRFFDGTTLRLDQSTDIEIIENARGKKTSYIDLRLAKGSVWVRTPSQSAYSGTIVRTINGSPLAVELPPNTEALLSQTAIQVFEADGQGVSVRWNGGDPFLVGDGQQWTQPADGQAGSDPYAYRTAIDAQSVSPLVAGSRAAFQIATVPAAAHGGTATTDILTVTTPADDALLRAGTLTVRGSVGQRVTSVHVNGYSAPIDASRGFSLEVSPPEGQSSFDVKVDAYDAERKLLDSITRIVRREGADTLPTPTIDSPAKQGETYRTQQEEVVIRGSSPAGAASMYVNTYKLQLFSPEKGTWSYLASTRLGNLKPGLNTYDVTAADAAGKRSESVRLTILWEAGAEGTISAGTTSSALDPSTLPHNAPLAPQTLSVTAPTAGAQHLETGTGFLMEGRTSASTVSIWVNDYRLQLYKPGVTTWNYIASEALGNLKQGTNVYTIIARDKDNQILDRFEYSVTH